MTPELHIPRGESGEVHLQFTIPFISRNTIFRNRDIQRQLYISMNINGKSVSCDNQSQKDCDMEVNAFKKIESEKYNLDDWKNVHTKKVFIKDDGDYAVNYRQLTLKFETGSTHGTGSKIFEKLSLQDVQVYFIFSLYNCK